MRLLDDFYDTPDGERTIVIGEPTAHAKVGICRHPSGECHYRNDGVRDSREIDARKGLVQIGLVRRQRRTDAEERLRAPDYVTMTHAIGMEQGERLHVIPILPARKTP